MHSLQDFIDQMYQQVLEGRAAGRDELIRMLSVPIGSEGDYYLRSRAREAASALTNDHGYVWCAIGTDYQPCSMNCRFCSFGEEWNLIQEQKLYEEDEIFEAAGRYIQSGADYVVLRTTEFYPLEKLEQLAAKLHKRYVGDYEVIVNTGELDVSTTIDMSRKGIQGVYHALRLREGIDTPFDPQVRKNTMNSVYKSPLRLVSLVEPIGPEHTFEEISDNYLNIMQYQASISGAMARIPVPGTPLGETRQLNDEEIAHIIASLRLGGGGIVRDICVHPASLAALQAGANVVVVESGAIPRDVHIAKEEWHGFQVEQAEKMLNQAGYRHDKNRF